MNLGRKCTPPKVYSIPYFPMVKEENARQGFLTDQQYAKLRDEFPDYLKPLFITAYVTGVRLGELLAWTWDRVDFAQSSVTLHADETKSGYSRTVPIWKGTCANGFGGRASTLRTAPESSTGRVSQSGSSGLPWKSACESAGVLELKFHDLRRTAVRNMRRAGVPQVVRMRITGHRTDSMERRYNIVDIEDIKTARQLMERATTESASDTVDVGKSGRNPL